MAVLRNPDFDRSGVVNTIHAREFFVTANNQRIEINRQDVVRFVRVLALVATIVTVLVLGSRSMYSVEPSERAVVLRFGKFLTTSEPGLHFCIPFVDEVLSVDMRERTLRLPIGAESSRVAPDVSEEDVLMLTGDLNAAAVEWTVQWQISDPQQYLFTFHDSSLEQDEYLQGVISVVGRTVMNRLVGDYSIDEVLTGKRSEIGQEAELATQRILDTYECGIRITDLQMQRVTPPEQVKPSFAAVNEAVQLRDKYINEASRERNELIPKANAERDKAIREAEGYAARRRSEVKGEIDSLMAQYEQYAKAPEETRRRLYLESMERVLSSVKDKTIIDSDLNQLLPLLQLDRDND
ncbi:MAG: FtsH protease activity modulator HflK [Planctomycetaceae bacterium]|nr:FtsH protease activity modulator HflK [Planctomycetaceae bacterium]